MFAIYEVLSASAKHHFRRYALVVTDLVQMPWARKYRPTTFRVKDRSLMQKVFFSVPDGQTSASAQQRKSNRICVRNSGRDTNRLDYQ
jgi:hypothetical protein